MFLQLTLLLVFTLCLSVYTVHTLFTSLMPQLFSNNLFLNVSLLDILDMIEGNVR
jgi:hypothetical protein